MNLRALLPLLFLLLCISCNPDDAIDGPDSGVDFNINYIISTTGPSQANLDEATLLWVTIANANGNTTEYALGIEALGQEAAGVDIEALALPAGDYQLTRFFVTNSENDLTHITPSSGYPLAQNVIQALPIAFTVSPDNITPVNIGVIAREGLSLADFGLAGFDFSRFGLFPLAITVAEQGNPGNVIAGTLTVTSGAYRFTQALDSIINNSVHLKEGFAAYELTIETAGYRPFSETYSRESLSNFETSPLTIQLIKQEPTCPGSFINSGQALGDGIAFTNSVSLGDLDGDGDLDAFVSNIDDIKVWVNDGLGSFTNSGQSLEGQNNNQSALGDLDGDGDLDAFVPNSIGGNTVWFNVGNGVFTNSGQALGNNKSRTAALADLDGDGDLDAFVANALNPNTNVSSNTVWLNDGTGNFSATRQTLGNFRSQDVALADLDRDGDIDAFVTNYTAPNKVWLNSGNGIFIDSEQELGNSVSYNVSLGDLDGDGDTDAFVTNNNQPDRIWLNDGDGAFADGGLTLDAPFSQHASLGDVDGDGDLDIFLLNYYNNRVWINDGSGTFRNSGFILGVDVSTNLALGDLNGDGCIDAFVGQGNYKPNQVFLNGR